MNGEADWDGFGAMTGKDDCRGDDSFFLVCIVVFFAIEEGVIRCCC